MANQDGQKEQPVVSRRKFLQNTSYAIGGLVVGGVVGSLLKTDRTPAEPPPAAAPEAPDFNQALMHFNQEQFKVIDAATERIYPKDESGPGARDLGVAFFIDHQLAGDWGFNAREYMQGPFYKGEKVQGYQGRLKRREIFDIGIREMQNHSMATYKKNFYELAPEQQDEVLKAFEEDKVKVTAISPSGFFKTLVTSTMEGAYADPLYGGNRNMDGWKMKNFPGNKMSYAQAIDKDFEKIPPSSLREHLSH